MIIHYSIGNGCPLFVTSTSLCFCSFLITNRIAFRIYYILKCFYQMLDIDLLYGNHRPHAGVGCSYGYTVQRPVQPAQQTCAHPRPALSVSSHSSLRRKLSSVRLGCCRWSCSSVGRAFSSVLLEVLQPSQPLRTRGSGPQSVSAPALCGVRGRLCEDPGSADGDGAV